MKVDIGYLITLNMWAVFTAFNAVFRVRVTSVIHGDRWGVVTTLLCAVFGCCVLHERRTGTAEWTECTSCTGGIRKGGGGRQRRKALRSEGGWGSSSHAPPRRRSLLVRLAATLAVRSQMMPMNSDSNLKLKLN